jgi:hypothetical protein
LSIFRDFDNGRWEDAGKWICAVLLNFLPPLFWISGTNQIGRQQPNLGRFLWHWHCSICSSRAIGFSSTIRREWLCFRGSSGGVLRGGHRNLLWLSRTRVIDWSLIPTSKETTTADA